MEKKKRLLIIVLAIAIIFFTLVLKAASSYFGIFLGINTESCLKQKYFLVVKHYKKLKEGDFFVFRFKGSKLYPKGTLFVKIVGCSAGKHLYTKKENGKVAYYCNKKFLGYACDRNKYPRCPEHLLYNLIVPPGKYYAMATSFNAYDSRYYGLVSANSIIGKAFPLF